MLKEKNEQLADSTAATEVEVPNDHFPQPAAMLHSVMERHALRQQASL